MMLSRDATAVGKALMSRRMSFGSLVTIAEDAPVALRTTAASMGIGAMRRPAEFPGGASEGVEFAGSCLGQSLAQSRLLGRISPYLGQRAHRYDDVEHCLTRDIQAGPHGPVVSL